MQSSSLFLLVLLALGALVPWTVEGAAEGAANALKAGNCPAGRPGRCLNPPLTPPCQSDWQCPGRQLCCSDVCGFTCLDPVSVSDPTRRKPGSCPQVNGQCLILSPRNYCNIDGDCVGDYKCCTGLCGKSCVEPELA
ncbi:antileukoproteinase-like [Suricata suricatta]|uniref:Secretory leukocyte peptidase inhibitor n=1 Tax=Suricata suricatta TaxID=37032 RepID=A0A673UI86_SURSU|nr:antileukoproteinase-like [Suricata suricatta]